MAFQAGAIACGKAQGFVRGKWELDMTGEAHRGLLCKRAWVASL